MKLENNETVTDAAQVNKEIEAFYQRLYTSKSGDKDTLSNNYYDEEFDDFTEDLNIPQLTEEEQEPLEIALTLEEMKNTLASFGNNKFLIFEEFQSKFKIKTSFFNISS